MTGPFPSNIQTQKHNNVVNDDVIRQLVYLKPKTVVDVGAGDGFYGKLVRYFLPGTFITAVEKRKDYILQWQLTEIYDGVINDDIVNAISLLTGDLIVFGDVLEHLEKKDSVEVLGKAVRRFDYVLINAPVGFQPQEHQFEEEIHKCGIDRDDFCGYNVLEYHTYCNGAMFNCLLRGIR